jgi:hypothetical protein
LARNKKETDPEVVEDQHDEDEGEEGGEGKLPKAPTVILDPEETMGIGPGGGGYITFYMRPLYREHTVSYSPRWGEKVHEAGSYGPWKAVSWPGGKWPIVHALRIAANKMMDNEFNDDQINAGGDIDLLADRMEGVLKAFEARLMKLIGDKKL